MNHFIRGAKPPADDGPPVYDVRVPAVGQRWDVTVLSEFVLAEFCHWDKDEKTGKATCARCTAAEGSCARCKDRHKPRWHGFLACYDHARRSVFVLRTGKESMGNLARCVGRTLRGRRLDCWRAGKGPTAALDFALSQHPPLVHVPACPDVRPTMMLVIGCDRLSDYEFSAKELREEVPS